MIEFYLIEDSKEDDFDPDLSLEYLGGLEADIFDRLQRKKVIDDRYSYYSDFRWYYADIVAIIKRTDGKENDTDIRQLISILKRVKASFGLMASCD